MAEYIWVDGTKPSSQIRSKTKVLNKGETPPIWGFDGSSTNQATGNNSDCVLSPVFTVPDTIRGGDNIVVLCEVLNTDMSPHVTNTRSACVETATKYLDEAMIFGLEQEYTLFKNGAPLGFPETGFPSPQGAYYCGNGASRVFGRKIVEEHLYRCLKAGLSVNGVNAEVMPGQWEFQVGAISGVEVSDHLWMARYFLERLAESYEVTVCYDPKPVEGDWNGAGCHANFSTATMRQDYTACLNAAKALAGNTTEHINNYGEGIEKRLTGNHETCSWKEFKYGVSDRTASVRIPWQVAKNGCGYIEDRRPNANCDPYVVTRLITETVCSNITNTRS